MCQFEMAELEYLSSEVDWRILWKINVLGCTYQHCSCLEINTLF